MNQISENLFNAIDIIIQERLKNLRFDRTIVCTVIEKSKENWYRVSYQGLMFEAQSDISTLKKNDQVYVLIPENDETNRRFIIGVYYKSEGGDAQV